MQETLTTVLYTPEEELAVTRAIEARFGKVSQVLREVVSRDIRVDLCVVAPGPGRAYQTVVTRGMGARDMRVPEDAHAFARAELVFMLPEDWELRSRDECWYWPLRWLKLLARLPAEENSWLGWGHTVPGGEPFAENTDFDSVLLLDAFV
ncbi:MAG: suppressor of fused domain protein, partial [Oscillospiraceae bacterium]|nr:suppressor of fused domain protein [Oscillospiraceae bacterium]